jgi:Integrase core domain/Chromo (CHRromatin Organisation MOdifier) domain
MKKADKTSEQLKKTYYNANTGYGGIDDLSRKTGQKPGKVKEFLDQQDVYTLHRPIRKKFARRKVYVHKIDEQWQADLVDMNLKEFGNLNHPFKYILTVIDCFSKYTWAVPIKNKTGDEIVAAFTRIFTDYKRIPNKIQTDAGTEFYNSKVKKLFKENKIDLFSTKSDLKASIIERFNRTLKEKMWKVFSERNIYKWIDFLQDLVENYNTSYHRSIKMTPNEASKSENEPKVHENLFETEKIIKPGKFKIGDKVRIARYKSRFDKGYMPNYTTEIFVIYKVLPTNPVTYKIKDLANEVVECSFYEQELVKYDKQDDTYKIEKIIRKRNKGGNKELFVKWYGYPDSFNSWVDENDF